jgi:hypothetical protein
LAATVDALSRLVQQHRRARFQLQPLPQHDLLLVAADNTSTGASHVVVLMPSWAIEDSAQARLFSMTKTKSDARRDPGR